tara:strand:- start:1165 stop:1836 length:672 start_codon:yes stop_codon:yes gene_type:complete
VKELMENWREYLTERKEYPSDKEDKRKRNMLAPHRGRSWVHGKEELDALAHGIAEEDKDKKNCSPGNPNHHGSDGDPPGGFAAKDDAGSWSLDYHSGKTGCEKGKLKKLGGGGTQWTKADKCGRDGEWLCSDPKRKKWDEMLLRNEVEDDGEFIKIKKSALDRLLDAGEDFDEDEVVIEGNERERAIATCKRMGLMTFNDFLLTLNKTRRAEDGKLLEPEKKK